MKLYNKKLALVYPESSLFNI